MIEDIDVLKSLSVVRGDIDKGQYLSILKNVFERLGVYGVRERSEEDVLLREYIRRKYKVGGKRLEEYVEVLRKIRGTAGLESWRGR